MKRIMTNQVRRRTQQEFIVHKNPCTQEKYNNLNAHSHEISFILNLCSIKFRIYFYSLISH